MHSAPRLPRIQEEASKNRRKHKLSNFLEKSASVNHSQWGSCVNAGALYHMLEVARGRGGGAELQEANADTAHGNPQSHTPSQVVTGAPFTDRNRGSGSGSWLSDRTEAPNQV